MIHWGFLIGFLMGFLLGLALRLQAVALTEPQWHTVTTNGQDQFTYALKPH